MFLRGLNLCEKIYYVMVNVELRSSLRSRGSSRSGFRVSALLKAIFSKAYRLDILSSKFYMRH